MQTASFFTFNGSGRIAISRSVPRGISPGFLVCRKLAPGVWFNSVPRNEYERLFRLEILGPLDPQRMWDELHAMTGGAEPVLLCFERPPFTWKNYCHRRMVAEWFEMALGVVVPEYGQSHMQGQLL